MTADDPDEIDWLGYDLAHTLDEARAEQPARGPPRHRPPCPRPRRRTCPTGLHADCWTGCADGARERLTYSVRNNPSWTTDTSRRPSLS